MFCDFFLWIEMIKVLSESMNRKNYVHSNGLIYTAVICYTKITNRRMMSFTNQN